MRRHLATLGALVSLLATTALAQDVGIRGGWIGGGPDFHTVWGTWEFRLPVQLGLTLGVDWSEHGTLYGGGLEAGFGIGSWAVIGSATGGLTGGMDQSSWGSWSGGLRWTPIQRPLSLGVEGRYLRLSPFDGPLWEFTFRIGFPRGGASTASPAAAPPSGSAPLPPVGPAPDAGAARGYAVVATALEVLGTPYVWGGSSENGFDCSGLIQYAWSRHGVVLPRRSVDQARAGREVERSFAALLPGDVLTFAVDGQTVSHVGLYVGDGRFIHSSSSGVKTSRLDPGDPDGRYWWPRWVGARRVTGG